MSNIELVTEVSNTGQMSWLLVDPVSQQVYLRTKNADLANRCLADIQQHGYIKLEK